MIVLKGLLFICMITEVVRAQKAKDHAEAAYHMAFAAWMGTSLLAVMR